MTCQIPLKSGLPLGVRGIALAGDDAAWADEGLGEGPEGEQLSTSTASSAGSHLIFIT
ncbi:MAG: hypothetical protein VX751_05480 [Pseudomonadota bacterium]|nr:hypothetical protein [Gammaproteobacteria bacterium]MEC7460340.1 hypothetical protein [Pseudomonadota bacterium]